MKTLRCIVGMMVMAGWLAPSPSAAADNPIPGYKLKVSDNTQPGVARRKVVFATRDATIVVPADGGSGDPSLNGGTLEIANTAGSGESQTFALSASNWRRRPGDPVKALKGWIYKEVLSNPPADDYRLKVVMRSAASGNILRVGVKDDRGSFITYTLDEAMQGSMGVRLTTGDLRQCTDFGGTVVADESQDLGSGVYRGTFTAKAAGAPPDCGSPSGAFVD